MKCSIYCKSVMPTYGTPVVAQSQTDNTCTHTHTRWQEDEEVGDKISKREFETNAKQDIEVPMQEISK